MPLITRQENGVPLTIEQLDENFIYLESISGGSGGGSASGDLQNVLDNGGIANNIPETFIQSLKLELTSEGLGAPASLSLNKAGSGKVILTSLGAGIDIVTARILFLSCRFP